MAKSLSDFCAGTYPIFDLMPSGAKSVKFEEKRRAIGFGREGEVIEKSPANLLLEKLGMRRAIGYGREGELIKNGPSGKETAVGYGRENEPAALPAKAGKKIKGYRIAKLKDRVR